MSNVKIIMPYGSENIELTLDQENIIGVYSPKDVAAVADVKQEVLRGLYNPIGTKPLRELVKDASKVVILADDNTRLTPTEVIIPVLLDEMNLGGIKDEQITLIIALGTHRFMTQEEILRKFGGEVVRRITIKNHDFKNKKDLVDLGNTPNGTSIWVNREAYEADFIIGVGTIVPHHIPGFSGGAKIVQPGISGEDTTAQTHLLSVRAPRSYLGLEDNPVRRELNKIAAQVGMHTIFNTVLNRHGKVVSTFFGDVEEAFASGVKLAKEVYEVKIPREADIVVASSHPCDIEFWQAHKTLYPSDLAVKAGGTIILLTPCYEGIAVTHDDIMNITCHSSQQLKEMVKQKKLPDEVAAALAIAWAQVKEREQVYIVSEGIDQIHAEKLGFIFFATVQEAVAAALIKHGKDAKITILTHAPDMLPITQERT